MAFAEVRADPEWRAVAYTRAERALTVPMLVLSVLLVPVLLLPLVWRAMPADVSRALDDADLVIWGAFVVEYVLLLGLAPDRRRFFRTHLLELGLVALPMLRPLRVLRASRALRAARIGRAALGATRAVGLSRRRLAVSGALYAPLAAVLVSLAAAVVILDLERDAKGATITSLPDALWWAMTTISTVGYGDRFPVTSGGRVVAGVLMVFGIALLGVITAGVAAAFVRWSSEPAERGVEADHAAERVQLADVLDELRAVRRELEALRQDRV